MLSIAEVRKINEELAEKINEEARRDPTSPYGGKFIGVANGQIVVVEESWDKMGRRLREIEPDPARTLCLHAGAAAEEVQEIWLTPHGGGLLSPLNEIQLRNEALARKINQEALRDPTSPYAGKFVGIASGQVVVVAHNWDEVVSRLDAVERDPRKTLCLEASMDPDEVHEV